jgi:hypothetical protein
MTSGALGPPVERLALVGCCAALIWRAARSSSRATWSAWRWALFLARDSASER